MIPQIELPRHADTPISVVSNIKEQELDTATISKVLISTKVGNC